MRLIALLCLLAYSQLLIGQGDWKTSKPETSSIINLEPIANTISTEELKQHLSILASDEFEGRETGKEGQRKAAEYIAQVFDSLGLPTLENTKSHFQRIAFLSQNWKNIRMQLNGENVRHLRDFYAYPSTNSERDTATFSEVVFLGYGIENKRYNDYKNQDVKGKTILIYDKEPINKKGVSYISKKKELSDWSTDWRKKLRAAKKHGVATVLIIDSDFKNNIAAARKVIINHRLQLGEGEHPEENYANNFFVSSTLAKKIIGDRYQNIVQIRKKIQKKGRPLSLSLPCELQLIQRKNVKKIIGENVLGYVEGLDADLKEELVVVTAHYDHLGKRGKSIYYGADDNGSGTSAVLEICEAFVEAKKQGIGPRRSVLFMLVSGEEKGLLGSEYYINNPVFPLENTIANINVDMIGRVDKKHLENPNYIYVIGADRLSTALHLINEEANNTSVQLELDYTYNAKDDPNRYYYRSDHYNFAEKGIPAIFYFSGTHKDYHKTTDTVDKINFDKMKAIATLVFYTTWELANRDERIKVDVKQD